MMPDRRSEPVHKREVTEVIDGEPGFRPGRWSGPGEEPFGEGPDAVEIRRNQLVHLHAADPAARRPGAQVARAFYWLIFHHADTW
ncbi:hypothetical protein ACFXI8_30205 [Streptomyces niveus]|uniref:hypothetical protein n=1 Tax=Streptomyces niveus TaxID=193462 RepID=UPI0036758ABB